EELRKCANNDPNSAEPKLALGQFYLTTGKLSQAEAELRRALDLNPKLGAALYALALVQTQGQRFDEAEQNFRKLATLPEKAYRPLYGEYLWNRGKRDEAIAELRQIVAQNPKEAEFRTLLVSAYVADNRTTEAQKVLNEALKQNPRDHDALMQD